MTRAPYFCTVIQPGDRRTTVVVKSTTPVRAAKVAARLISPETGGESVKQQATAL